MKRMILFLSTGIKHIDFVLFIGFVKMGRRAKKNIFEADMRKSSYQKIKVTVREEKNFENIIVLYFVQQTG